MRSFISLFVFLCSFLAGCEYDPCDPLKGGSYYCDWRTSASDEQGASDLYAIQLPFAAGDVRRCTQGAGGSYSHTGTSTKHDVDLDTLNTEQEEIYAPVAGIAQVHTESATTNFGYHLNIGLGDGSYVVVAHLDEIFIEDGAEVTAGQLIGYEGCTGACTGDHVHVGRHEGEAELPAQSGTSVEVAYYTRDTSDATAELTEVSGEDFVCDVSSGHVYESALPVTSWHPSGSLVKVPNNPNVYLVDGGQARHIEDETVFWSHGYDFADMALISDEELDCLGEGAPVDEEGVVDAGYMEETGEKWLVVSTNGGEDSFRQRVGNTAWEQVFASWGLVYDSDNPPAVYEENDPFFTDYPERSGNAPFRDGTVVKESSQSDVYVISDGVALPVDDWATYLLLGFEAREIVTVDSGEVSQVMDRVGDCASDVWCLDAEAVTTCGGGLELGSGENGGTDEVDTGFVDSQEEEDTDEPRDTGSILESDTDTDEPQDTGAESEEGDDTAEPEEAVDTADTAETEDTATTDDWSAYLWIDGFDLCFSTDGMETSPYTRNDAFVVGYGGDLDWTLDSTDLVSLVDDAFCVDTTSWPADSYELTLVSSVDKSENSITTLGDVEKWWQNANLCASDSATDSNFCVSQGGGDYLVGVRVTSSGTVPDGDGT